MKHAAAQSAHSAPTTVSGRAGQPVHLAQSTPASESSSAVAAYDNRPFFARALDFGLKNGIIDSEKLEAMRVDGAKGVVQIADFFGTAHLRTDLDDAVKRMVYLASLYLEHVADGHLPRAARSLQDHTFLSHSRGGSEMLKKLYAMPTDSIIHEPLEADGVKEFLRARTLTDQWSVGDYRARLAECLTHQAEIDAACWFADVMELSPDTLFGESADNILHACLLTRIAGKDQGGLLTAAELKKFLTAFRRAKKKQPVKPGIIDDVPEQHRALIEQHLARMIKREMPRIIDMKVPFNDLLRDYHERFHPFATVDAVSDYDALVTNEWRKVTKGSTDSDSMNTIFLCLAAGLPPKPAISATEAKAAVRAIRNDPAGLKSVTDFIHRSAPHQMIDGLVSLWTDEFLPDVVEPWILDDLDDALEPLVRLLAEHCHIKAPAKRR